VHFGPHGLIDVQAWNCDYLVCSGYKNFSPHMGFLWGRYDALCALPTFKEDFIPDVPPHKIEVGTFPYENVAGMNAAVKYLESIGRRVARATVYLGARRSPQAMRAIGDYERLLSREMILALKRQGATIYGVSDENASRSAFRRSASRSGITPQDFATLMGRGRRRAARRASVRAAPDEAPRPLDGTGAIRVSLVHYNTIEEIHRFEHIVERVITGGGCEHREAP
jgi:selenocysteine lyase/cysteine desulfurase